MRIPNKICKLYGLHHDWAVLRASCACGDSDHMHDISVSIEEDAPGVIVSFDTNIEYCAYQTEWHGNIFQRIWSRTKAVCSIIFTGRLTMSSTFVFDSEEQVRDYIQAINDTIIEIRTQQFKK